MLSTPVALRSLARWARHTLLWVTAVLMLVFANPRTADAVEELLSYVTGVECCDSCSCEGCQGRLHRYLCALHVRRELERGPCGRFLVAGQSRASRTARWLVSG